MTSEMHMLIKTDGSEENRSEILRFKQVTVDFSGCS